MKLLTPFAIENPQQTHSRKLLFAAALLKNPGDPFAVALTVVPDTGEALRAAQEWPADFEVMQEQQRLIAEQGEAAFLPGEVETARLFDDMARGRVFPTMEKIAAAKAYAEMRGWIGKAVTINNQQNNVTVNRVMVVKEAASDEDWQIKAKRQQARLRSEVIEHAGG